LMVLVTPKFVKPLNPDQLPPLPEAPKPFLDPQKFDGKVGTVDGGTGASGSTPSSKP